MSPLEKLFDRLGNGWETTDALCKEFGWQPHSLRGRICNVSTKFKVKIERQRVDGVTMYRVAPEFDVVAVDADDGQPSEMQEWLDYDRDC